MKHTPIAVLAWCLCLLFAGAEEETGVEFDGYKGRVKSVKYSSLTITEKFGKPVRTRDEVGETRKYDEKGNMVEIAIYGAQGTLTAKTTSKYDTKGNKGETVRHDASGKMAPYFRNIGDSPNQASGNGAEIAD